MDKNFLYDALSQIIETDRVSVDDAVLWAQSESRYPVPPRKREAVVLPTTVEEVVEIVKFANKEKIPIFTVGAGDADYGGPVPVSKDGILMDFSQMNKIWEINETEMYALIEPGVTIGQLQKELAKHDLLVAIPSAPHTTSILGNYVPQQGIGCWAARHGGNEKYVRGVQVVLPNGDVVRTGSAAFLHKIWHHRNNLGADLTGLFLGSHGCLGIVTKGAIGVIPKPEAYGTLFLDFNNVSDCFKHINYLAKHELGDYISGQNFMMSLGGLERYPYDVLDGRTACPKEILEEMRKRHNIAPYWFHISLIGSSKVLKARRDELDEYIKREKLRVREGPGTEIKEDTDLWAFVREAQGFGWTTSFASRVAQWRGGRMTFHNYAPMSKWVDLVEPGVEILRKHGLECGITLKCLGPYGHSSQLRFVTWFNEKDPTERQMVREAFHDIAEHSIKHGATIFRHLHPDMNFVLEKEPEFAQFIRRIKNFLDPNRILNPGVIGL